MRLRYAVVVAAVALAFAGVAVAHGGHYSHRATVYSGPCDGMSNTMADGTHIASDGSLWRNGKRVDDHVLASSVLPMHTRIRFDHRVYGKRDWIVRDSGGAFDLYRPNCRYGSWDNPTLWYRVR